MKKFFKYVFATILGVFVSMAIVAVIGIIIVSILLSSSEKTYKVKPNSLLFLKLDQPIVDRKPAALFDIPAFSGSAKIGLTELLENIRKAKTDENIKGIHLDLSFVNAGLGTIEEIRNALKDFRTSGKFVTVYSETMTQGAYYLSTAADEIYLNPIGMLNFVGMRAQGVFFKNALKKLEIEPTVIKYGTYKSAAESFTEEEFSKANSEQMQVLIQSLWRHVCEGISESRGITVEELNRMANELLVENSDSAYQLKLVDSLVYRDELLTLLKAKTGIEESKDLNAVSLDQYASVPAIKAYKGIATDKIAVIYASGDIIPGEGTEGYIGSENFGRVIRKARRDSTIKAIVLRVNSPGGSAIASEVIWRELELARKDKPVIISMGDVAASGGYYISCMADTILAQPVTITGSIGVISLFLNTQGFFNKYGITFDTEKTNTYADFMSGVRPMSETERNFWQNSTNHMYATFAKRVGDGRNLSFPQVDSIGQGRVWTGTDAKSVGLIDKFGGISDAIEIAKKMAGLSEKYRLVELPEQEDPLMMLFNEFAGEARIRSIESELGLDARYFYQVKGWIKNQGLLTRLPMDIEIY